MDVRGYHALKCRSGGCRTIRHNEVRDQFYLWAKDARWAPHKEKPDLLPSSPDAPTAGRRRPADVFVPTHGAVDFAITDPHKPSIQYAAARERGAAGRAYEAFKREYLDTAADCAKQGFAFLPAVFETSGARAPTVSRLLGDLARARASRRGAETASTAQRQNEALSVMIRRRCARMLLRRLGGPPMGEEAWRSARARATLATEPQPPALGAAASCAAPPPLAASPAASPPPHPALHGAIGDAVPFAASGAQLPFAAAPPQPAVWVPAAPGWLPPPIPAYHSSPCAQTPARWFTPSPPHSPPPSAVAAQECRVF
eukprot:gene19433-biopygen17453